MVVDLEPRTVIVPLSGEVEFQALADNVPQLMWIADADGWIYWYNKGWYQYTGTTPSQMEGWGWQSVHDEHQLQAVLENWTRSIATGQPFEMVFPLRAADGEFHPFLTRVHPFKDAKGVVIRWFGTNTDISHQKKAEEHLQFLLNELNHRVKNTLASVQGIALNTFKGLPQQQVETFSDRLVALSRAHDLLLKGNWARTSLEDLVELSVAPLAGDTNAARVIVDGPAVAIPAEKTAAWAMALHELSTNAVKYGALKTPVGKIKVGWNVDGAKLTFSWREQGGPLLTTPPQHRGFGSRLIESLARELGGSVKSAYEPTGLICEIDVPYHG